MSKRSRRARGKPGRPGDPKIEGAREASSSPASPASGRGPAAPPRPSGSPRPSASPRPTAEARRAPRWPLWLVAAALAIAFLGLLGARHLPGKQFLYGLLVTGAGLGLAAAALVAVFLGNRLFATGVTGPVSALLAGISAVLRLLLVASRPNPAEGPVQVLMWREILLGAPLVLATVALFLGAYAVHRTIALPPGGLAPRPVKLDLGAAILGLAGALFTLGPLFRSLGVPLNHWTFLGLVALGFAAFLVVTLLERIFGRGKAKKPS
ncbi:MAG: hypothetical protein RBU30_13840 [Polyangia bacterium]|nr:hypothetical protein [Polyangia bacterium]